MCKTEQNDKEDNSEKENSTDKQEQEMTKVELEQKVREHIEKRKDAYVKMGTVDQ